MCRGVTIRRKLRHRVRPTFAAESIVECEFTEAADTELTSQNFKIVVLNCVNRWNTQSPVMFSLTVIKSHIDFLHTQGSSPAGDSRAALDAHSASNSQDIPNTGMRGNRTNEF